MLVQVQKVILNKIVASIRLAKAVLPQISEASAIMLDILATFPNCGREKIEFRI